jgi:hypothetical protein
VKRKHHGTIIYLIVLNLRYKTSVLRRVFSMRQFMGLNLLVRENNVENMIIEKGTPGSFFFVALRPNAGHGLLVLEVSRSHTTMHHSR